MTRLLDAGKLKRGIRAFRDQNSIAHDDGDVDARVKLLSHLSVVGVDAIDGPYSHVRPGGNGDYSSRFALLEHFLVGGFRTSTCSIRRRLRLALDTISIGPGHAFVGGRIRPSRTWRLADLCAT